jgi:hypothetical protein
MTPDFDELVGQDVERAERERLRNVHELLISAGPPAELPPHMEAGPTLAMTLAKPKKPMHRRVALLAAAIVVLALAFLGGYLAGNDGTGIARGQTMELAGTKAAPGALASLRLSPADTSGNLPMTLTATGLPKLREGWYYEVYLVRNGKIFAPCGWFVSSGADHGVDVTLNAPYELQEKDTWVVAKQHWRSRTPGPVVLRPTTSA